MDYPEFIILRLRAPEDFYPLPGWLRIWPGPGKHRRKYRWLRWKLPVEGRPVECLQTEGEELKLPFTEADLDAYSKEEITDMLHRIIMEKGVQNMVVDAPLEPFLESGLRMDGEMLPLLMVNDIVTYVCRLHQISRKDLRPVVLAASRAETFWVLKKLGTQLNRLTIVTEEPTVYEDFVHRAYEEQGLLVRLQEWPLDREVYGNVILELTPKRCKDYVYYPKDSVILNLSGNFYRTQDVIVKRKDLTGYNRFDISAEGEEEDNRVLQAVIYGTSRSIGCGQLEKGEKIKDLYDLRVEKTGIES